MASHLGVRQEDLVSVELIRKSLDARHGKKVWTGLFRVEVRDEARLLKRQLPGVRAWTERDEARYGGGEAHAPIRHEAVRGPRPIVVGAGPAGLFAALFLAESGLPPIVLERGSPVEDRVREVNDFWRRKAPLDPESNVVFGEGGSGTFSDGKIYTRRRDGELGWIFRRLIDCGADDFILKDPLAHLGTDKVREILPAFRARLASLGVEIRFRTRVTGLLLEGGRCVGVLLSDGTELRGAPVLVGAGHSARDTIEMLVRAGASAQVRPISVGVRVEHPQSVIDRGRYGEADRGSLPAATYRLAYNPTRGRKAHTFCMCPGGLVVPATNHPDRVVVNGMSFAARRAFWANSAVIVEVTAEDFGAGDPLAGFRWQDAIEAASFAAAGSDYRAPAQRFEDFRAGRTTAELPRTSFPMGVTSCDLRAILPGPLADGLLAAVLTFDREVPGFAGPEAVLIAPETRTTSPIRFDRDAKGESTTLPGLFPIGEGAGYAGGIVSSALDGMRAARAIVAERVSGS